MVSHSSSSLFCSAKSMCSLYVWLDHIKLRGADWAGQKVRHGDSMEHPVNSQNKTLSADSCLCLISLHLHRNRQHKSRKQRVKGFSPLTHGTSTKIKEKWHNGELSLLLKHSRMNVKLWEVKDTHVLESRAEKKHHSKVSSCYYVTNNQESEGVWPHPGYRPTEWLIRVGLMLSHYLRKPVTLSLYYSLAYIIRSFDGTCFFENSCIS